MINVRISEKENRVLISCEGHAGFAPKGQDIVCAAVSILSLSVDRLVHALYGQLCSTEIKEGLMRLSFSPESKPRVRAEMAGAVSMFAAGIAELQRLYPAFVSFDTDYLPLWVRYIDTPEETAEKERGGSV